MYRTLLIYTEEIFYYVTLGVFAFLYLAPFLIEF